VINTTPKMFMPISASVEEKEKLLLITIDLIEKLAAKLFNETSP
jgi:hypothetical protein